MEKVYPFIAEFADGRCLHCVKIGEINWSWLRWIYKLWDEAKACVKSLKLQDVKAHTEITPESSKSEILNQKADAAARSARSPIPSSKHAPWPTFEMDEYTAWNGSSYVELDFYKWTRTTSLNRRTHLLRLRYPERLNLAIYENSACTYRLSYLRSMSDYRFRIQAQARAGVLPTNQFMDRVFPGSSTECECGDTENDHHVFVNCPIYDDIRSECIARCQGQIT